MTRAYVLNAYLARIQLSDMDALRSLHQEIDDDKSLFTVIERAFLEGAIALATRIRLEREASASHFSPLPQESRTMNVDTGRLIDRDELGKVLATLSDADREFFGAKFIPATEENLEQLKTAEARETARREMRARGLLGNAIAKMAKDESGIAVTEYGLLIALVAILLIGVVVVFGSSVSSWFQAKTAAVTSV